MTGRGSLLLVQFLLKEIMNNLRQTRRLERQRAKLERQLKKLRKKRCRAT